MEVAGRSLTFTLTYSSSHQLIYLYSISVYSPAQNNGESLGEDMYFTQLKTGEITEIQYYSDVILLALLSFFFLIFGSNPEN